MLLDLHWRCISKGRTNSDEKRENTTTNFLLNVPLKDEAGFQCIKHKYIDYMKKKTKKKPTTKSDRKTIQKRNQLPVIDENHPREKRGLAFPETNTTSEITRRIS